jgi:hypothetical protein
MRQKQRGTAAKMSQRGFAGLSLSLPLPGSHRVGGCINGKRASGALDALCAPAQCATECHCEKKPGDNTVSDPKRMPIEIVLP